MWGVIALLAVSVGGLLLSLYSDKKMCERCEKNPEEAKCVACPSRICSSCGVEVPPIGTWCNAHGDIRASVIAAKDVKTFSKNFRGRTPDPKKSKKISTHGYRDRDHAEYELKFIAALEHAEFVTSVEFERTTDETGNYKFTIWTASGII